jgi:hypothetical protein
MKTLKTLKQAIKLSSYQLTANDILRGSLYTSKGWEKFNICDNLKDSLASQISDILGGHSKTKELVYLALKFRDVSHWGLDRIQINERKNHKDKRKKIISVNYCAGQDYVQECNEIRTYIKNLY